MESAFRHSASLRSSSAIPLGCWGWHFSPDRRELHFGAHDFGGTQGQNRRSAQEIVSVELPDSEHMKMRNVFHLETVVVNQVAVFV